MSLLLRANLATEVASLLRGQMQTQFLPQSIPFYAGDLTSVVAAPLK